MPYKYLIYLLGFTFLLSGCGLDTEKEEENEGVVTTASILIHDQNPFLPLTNSTAINYTDTNLGNVTAAIIYDQAESEAQGYNIYKMDFAYSGSTIGLVLSSTANEVSWIGIEGPFSFQANGSSATLNSLRFSSPIVLLGNAEDGSTSATVLTSSTLANNASYEIDYTIESTDGVFDPENDDYGTLPAQTVTLNANVEMSIGSLDPIPLSLNSTLTFVKGIGVVHHSGDYLGTNPDSNIDSLSNLPLTIWFESNAGAPILESGSSATFQTSAGELSTDSYFLYNGDELDALDWIEVSIDIASDTFEVEITATENLPEELTSVQVIFEDKQYPGRRLSGNVTLLED